MRSVNFLFFFPPPSILSSKIQGKLAKNHFPLKDLSLVVREKWREKLRLAKLEGKATDQFLCGFMVFTC